MQERGFDALQSGIGAELLIASTILLLLFIIVGGMLFRYSELRWRQEHQKEEQERLERAKAQQSH